jgi:SSS family solute:Na+ symporter
MGIIAAAVMAASMSSLSSAFTSLSTIATVDFYQRYYRKDAAPEHYLKVTRWFTVFWGALVILPAIAYSRSEGSILEVLSQVGSFFVGAQLGMYALGFFSRQATERGLLVGTISGFAVVWFVATQTDIAWPWFCLIGASSNIVVTLLASRIIDGRQEHYSPYTVIGQIRAFREEGRAEKDGAWYLVPGRVDSVSWYLLMFFALILIALYLLQTLVP